MRENTKQPSITWRDPERALSKINTLLNVDQVIIVADYDGTFTPAAGGNWHIMRNVLPQSGQLKHKALYNEYFPLECSGQLTDEKNRQWSSQALDLHVEHGTKLESLEQAMDNSELRPGATDFIESCRALGMPLIVVSAGVETAIRLAAKKHKLAIDNVIAVRLDFDENNTIKSWNKESLIIPNNKREKLQLELEKRTDKGRTGFIVIGDKLHDANMVMADEVNNYDKGSILRIMVGVDKADFTDKSSEIWKAGFDGVVIGEELYALLDLTQKLSK